MGNITQEDINNYILGSLHMPIQDRKHLEAMVILHFDVPNNKASEMVGNALIKALEYYRRVEIKQNNEIRGTQYMIAKLETWTPELNSEVIS